jgi:hypothetical protein
MKTKTYWLSFVSNEGNLGCLIIDGKDDLSAIEAAVAAKLHPGGQVLAVEISACAGWKSEVEKWGKNRLIAPSELIEGGYKTLEEVSEVEISKMNSDPRISVVREKHAP